MSGAADYQEMAASVLPSLKAITLTHVRYRRGDPLGLFLAWVSLVPVFISLGGFVSHFLFRRELQGLCFAAGLLVSQVLNELIKHSVAQSRPAYCELLEACDSHGWPSSHSQYMFFFATYLSLLSLRRSRARQVIAAVPWPLAFLTMLSRVYLGYHTVAQMHTKKRNRLEHKRLNKLVYVSYNRKMTNRFQKIRELGSKGQKCNPLLLEEFQWESEWVNENCEPVHEGDGADITWAHVDEAVGATQALRVRNLPRAAAARARAASAGNQNCQTYARRKKRPRKSAAAQDLAEDDDSDNDEIDEVEVQGQQSDVAIMDEDEDEDSGAPAAGAPTEDGGGFRFNEDLLD